jgi:neurobeachin-like protein/WD40 domain-containing protein
VSQYSLKLICVCIVVCAFGCAQETVEEPTRSVEIKLQAAGISLAGVPVKVIDEQAAAKAIVPLASTVNLQAGIPEASYADFFQALKPVDGMNIATTDHDGKAVINRLRSQHFVVACDGRHIWIVAASETRDRKLQLDPGNSGGQHALDLLVAQPAVLRGLTAAALESMHAGKFDRARDISHVTRSRVLLTEIDRAESATLLEQAEQAMKQKNYDSAARLAARAEKESPNQLQTEEFLQKILVDYGGELRVFTGHDGPVRTVAYSPDGKFLLSGGDDQTLELWDASSGKELRMFTGHSGAVTSVAFSPDGRLAVSGSSDSTVRLWEVASGHELQTTESLGWKVTSVAFSPDGRFIASAGDDNQVKLWALPKVQRVRAFTGHGWRVTSVAFSPDGNFSLSGSEDDSLKLWDVANGQELRSFRNGLANVTCVAFSPDGRFGLSGGRDKAVKLWNLTSGREVQKFEGHRQPVRSVAFTHDGRFVISASEDGTIKVWDLGTGKEFRTFRGHTAAVTGIAMSPDGHDLASSSADGSVRIWQLPNSVWPIVEVARK